MYEYIQCNTNLLKSYVDKNSSPNFSQAPEPITGPIYALLCRNPALTRNLLSQFNQNPPTPTLGI